MDGITRHKSQYESVAKFKLGEVVMGKTLWTHAESGLYRAEFDSADGEIVSGKKGKEYRRLTVRFKVVDGPYEYNEKSRGKKAGWTCKGRDSRGRLVALWHELEVDEHGRVLCSPNWWLAGMIQEQTGSTFDEKLQNGLKFVKWVFVQKREGCPAKVRGFSWDKDPPGKAWVDAVT